MVRPVRGDRARARGAGTESGGSRSCQLDVDENPETAARYGVLSLPTVILFADGEPRETVYGARPKKHFARVFAAYLST